MVTTQYVNFSVHKELKDSSVRIGQLSLNGYEISTPVLWLGHNFDRPISAWDNRRREPFNLLVNACEILRKPALTKAVCEKGIHEYLSYDGPIMMDSGGFLFQRSRNVSVSPADVQDLYERANVDIGVALDHPQDPSLPSFENRRRWKRTLKNTELMASLASSYAFMPVVHGYTLRGLKSACNQIKQIQGNPPLLGIGSLVPLIKGSYLGGKFGYRRIDGSKGDHVRYVADALMLVRDEFPRTLIHVFGVGGTTTILSLFALGADSVDSVAWRLKAAYGAIQLPGISDRFLSPRPKSRKTRRVIGGDELLVLRRCTCPVCSRYKRIGWQKRKLDSSFKARCIHNAWVYRNEVQGLRKAIQAGKTLEFLGKRIAKTHRFFNILVKER